MPLTSSGQISLNEIHIEAGGTSGTQATVNDADIRGLISKTAGVQMGFDEWYGASSVTTGSVSFTSGTFATEGSGTLGFTFTASSDGTYYYDVNRISGSVSGGEITNPGPTTVTISSGTGTVNIGFLNDTTTEIGFQGEQFVMRFGTTSNSEDLDTLNFTLYDDDSGISYSDSTIDISSATTSHSVSIVRATGDSSSAVTARVVEDGTTTAIGGTFSLSTGTTVRSVSDAPSSPGNIDYRVQVFNGNEYINGPTYNVSRAGYVFGTSNDYYNSINSTTGSPSTYAWVWNGTTVSTSSASTVTTGGFTYTRGAFRDTITFKGGSTSYYEISRR